MKEYATAFYTSAAWEKCRKAYAKSVGGLCEVCLSKGKYTPGKIVHHKIHITPENINDPNITLNWDNLCLVCVQCHNKIHEYDINPNKKRKRYEVDEFGRVTTPPIAQIDKAS